MANKGNSIFIEKLRHFRKINGYTHNVRYRKKKKLSPFRSMSQFEMGEPKTFVVRNDGLLERRNAGSISYIKMSKGELLIYTFLKNNEISFEREKTFNNCINPKTNFELRFDFFLSTYNICIEFDGLQHFRKSKKFGDTCRTYKNRVYRDKIKTQYCINNNITLIRIGFHQLKNINKILQKYISNKAES